MLVLDVSHLNVWKLSNLNLIILCTSASYVRHQVPGRLHYTWSQRNLEIGDRVEINELWTQLPLLTITPFPMYRIFQHLYGALLFSLRSTWSELTIKYQWNHLIFWKQPLLLHLAFLSSFICHSAFVMPLRHLNPLSIKYSMVFRFVMPTSMMSRLQVLLPQNIWPISD